MYMPEVMWYYYVYYWFLVTAVRALKDALQTLGHVTSINATLCKIDLASTSTSVTATEEKNAPTQAVRNACDMNINMSKKKRKFVRNELRYAQEKRKADEAFEEYEYVCCAPS
ncbi:unnamed protein product [Rhizophagus irregularis]|nr:unnamed protein product [Rhizophagus irregularis]